MAPTQTAVQIDTVSSLKEKKTFGRAGVLKTLEIKDWNEDFKGLKMFPKSKN